MISHRWIIKIAFRDAWYLACVRARKSFRVSSNVFGQFRTIESGMWKTNSRQWVRCRRGSETAKFAQWETVQTSTLIHRARHRTLHFSLIPLPPPIGRVPICPRTCCGPRHCQRVSEPVRRALIFGALWQHHGLHDYLFTQSHDRRGIVTASCNVGINIWEIY